MRRELSWLESSLTPHRVYKMRGHFSYLFDKPVLKDFLALKAGQEALQEGVDLRRETGSLVQVAEQDQVAVDRGDWAQPETRGPSGPGKEKEDEDDDDNYCKNLKKSIIGGENKLKEHFYNQIGHDKN